MKYSYDVKVSRDNCFAIEKCKMANSLWENSYFEQDIRNLLVKCQTAFGKSLNNMIKQRY